ncbi:transposable element Tcb2 transposase [Trichonephila clavipes]|nr:transposable element Tcb2 transposase [Trichonephila clavipes]
MSLRRLRGQYEKLSQFKNGRIMSMMEAGWSARRVASQLGHSHCVVRRCRDQWIREISFTQRPGSGRPRQTSRRQRLTGAIFQQDNALPHMERVSQDCLRTVTTFPWPARSQTPGKDSLGGIKSTTQGL